MSLVFKVVSLVDVTPWKASLLRAQLWMSEKNWFWPEPIRFHGTVQKDCSSGDNIDGNINIFDREHGQGACSNRNVLEDCASSLKYNFMIQ